MSTRAMAYGRDVDKMVSFTQPDRVVRLGDRRILF